MGFIGYLFHLFCQKRVLVLMHETLVHSLIRKISILRSKTTDTSIEVAETLFPDLFKYHGIPDSILSESAVRLDLLENV